MCIDIVGDVVAQWHHLSCVLVNSRPIQFVNSLHTHYNVMMMVIIIPIIVYDRILS